MSKILATESEFDNFINQDFAVVDFFAVWCGPCRMLAPIIDEVSAISEGHVAKLNVDDNSSVAARFGVNSIPTIIYFKNGKAVKTEVGYRNKQAILSTLETISK